MADDPLCVLVDRLYASVLDSELWPGFLASLTTTVGASCAAMHLHPQPGGQVVTAINVDPESQRAYNEYYASRNIWLLKRPDLLREGAVLTGEMVCGDAEFRASEYYNDYLAPRDLYHSIAAIPSTASGASMLFSFLAPRSRGPFTRRDVAMLKRLTPHLAQATRLHARLMEANIQRSAAMDALEHLPFGVVVFNGAGRALLANSSARRLAGARDGFELAADGPRGATGAETSALRRLIAMVATGLPAPAGGMVTLPRPSGKRALEGLVAPLGPRGSGLQQGAAGLFMVDPEAVPVLPAGILRRLYRMTRTEAEVAAAMATGVSVQELAVEFRMTRHTIRWFVRQVLEKTGTHSRGEAIGVLLRSLAAAARKDGA